MISSRGFIEEAAILSEGTGSSLHTPATRQTQQPSNKRRGAYKITAGRRLFKILDSTSSSQPIMYQAWLGLGLG